MNRPDKPPRFQFLHEWWLELRDDPKSAGALFNCFPARDPQMPSRPGTSHRWSMQLGYGHGAWRRESLPIRSAVFPRPDPPLIAHWQNPRRLTDYSTLRHSCRGPGYFFASV